MLTLPNILSASRILVLPLQLYLARTGHPVAFLAILGASLLSDAVDGFIARRLGQTSALGARLDSWGDMATYLGLPLCVWWLWPDVIRREAVFVVLALASYVVPVALGFVRFRRLTAYHTWTAKLSAVLMGVSVPIMLLWDVAWPFRTAVPIFLLSGIEDIAITATLRRWQPNIASLWHAVRLRREQPRT